MKDEIFPGERYARERASGTGEGGVIQIPAQGAEDRDVAEDERVKPESHLPAEREIEDELCACGQPLHYTDFRVKAVIDSMIRTFGYEIVVTTGTGSWSVPRHYIALHGLKGMDLPVLAKRFGWPRVEDN